MLAILPILAAVIFSIGTSQAEKGKAVVGIAGIQTSSQNISCKGFAQFSDCNKDLANGFRVMLETAIVKTGKMDVMERTQLDKVLGEQVIAEAGITTAGGEVGGLEGVDYLIYGTITKFGTKKSGFSLFGKKNDRSSATSKTTTEMAVDLKVTDVTNGQIIIADSVTGIVTTGKSFSFGGNNRENNNADPFADVQRAVAAKISEKIVTVKFPIKVI